VEKVGDSQRAGKYVPLREGVEAFLPKPLPPDPPVTKTDEYLEALTRAERNLGRLDATAPTLPDVDQFVYMYVRKEAVLSSQIEGTQSTLVDLLEYEAGGEPSTSEQDVSEVVNYVRALNHGLDRIEHGSRIDLDLIQDIQGMLLGGGGSGDRKAGSFRNEQVWIGFKGGKIEEAEFVPPPPGEVLRLMGDLETFTNSGARVPLLTRAGLIHFQFETIHPFFDGNGRVGRMLITLFLTREKALRRPLLYLSHYFRQRRKEYTSRLQAVRDDGDWEGWLTFFLAGVAQVSLQATATAEQIGQLREANRRELQELMGGRAGRALTLLDYLFAKPIVSVGEVQDVTKSSFPTANSLVDALESLGILREVTGQRHFRRFAYKPYIDVLNETHGPTRESGSPATPRSPAPAGP
jgi:Fic family protein